MIQTIRKLAVALVALAMGFQAAQAGEEGTKSANEQFATGWSFGVFGGTSFAQGGHLTATSPLYPGVSEGINTQDNVNGVEGLEGGYTWKGWKWGQTQVMPAVDGEFFATGSDYTATGSLSGFTIPGNGTLRTTLDTYVFSIDPKLKIQIGRFRPYIGFGLGAAYLTTTDGSVSGGGTTLALSGHEDDVVLAVQGLVGVETFLTRQWSLDLGYKYLDLIDPTLHASNTPAGLTPINVQGHALGQNIVTVGIKYYF